MLELIAGVVVAIVALVLVAQPLLFSPPAADPSEADDDVTPVEESDSLKVRALLALREIEFDRATGKLSDEDYDRLKAMYSAEAMVAIHAEDAAAALPAASTDGEADQAEALIRKARSRHTEGCPTCGPRPESGAVFCSTCGRSLVAREAAPRCWKCGADLPDDARFCGRCGKRHAA